ncbi:MAG: TetR/AcrR family transcriptional regulator [Alphaproteobacteria bacterium]|nr:TetR/AcrR family transcriptional regulator [Alphaproteobacteria bacterium]
MTRRSKSPLAAADWIKAAFRALSSGGVQAIRVEAIARDIKTTKGSFYWHFRDVPALKSAMLDHWRHHATEEIIAANAGEVTDPAQRLQHLIAQVTDERGAAYGGVRTEAAMREWARVDRDVADAVRGVDRRRLAYLQSIAVDLGYDEGGAAKAAQLLYAGLIGLEYLEGQGLANAAEALQSLGVMMIRGPQPTV